MIRFPGAYDKLKATFEWEGGKLIAEGCYLVSTRTDINGIEIEIKAYSLSFKELGEQT